MGLFRSLRRRHIVRSKLLSEDVWGWLLENHPILGGFSPPEWEELRSLTTLFLHTRTFEGAEGLALTEDMKAVVAVQACLPVLHLGLDWYGNWKSVVLVPDEFSSEHQETDPVGVVHEWQEANSGESWDQGPVVLSWEDVEASGWGEGYNVVIHEAAHRLDLLDGELNGRPALHRGMDPGEWTRVFSAAFQDLERRGRKRRPIDDYALENDGEFYAVLSETFFERPRLLRREYPDCYRLLAALHRQDPAGRLPA